MTEHDDPTLADRLAAALAAGGVDTMFGLPGGGPNLDVVGAGIRHGIRFVLAHGETAAAIMGSTHGRLTNSPTPVVVTRGPGAASVANGAAQATLDRFPLVVIADTVSATQAERVPHQRLDQRAMFAPLTKRSATVTDQSDPADLAELLAGAVQWPSGAVHLDFDRSGPPQPAVIDEPPAATLDPNALARAEALIAAAEKPVVIVGFEAAVWCQEPEVAAEVRASLEAFGCPVFTTYQAVGVVPTEGPVNAGLFTNGAAEQGFLAQADLIITVGLDEVEPIPAPWPFEAPVVRLSTVAQESPYVRPSVDVVAPRPDLLGLLSPPSPTRASNRWADGVAASWRADVRRRLADPRRSEVFGPLELVEVAAASTPTPATVTVDAGAHFLAVMPNWPVDEPLRLLISNGLATMGFAVPAAIGAALARPSEPVLALTGDGGLSMVLAELETIARLALPVTVLVFNDSALSLIEIKQNAEHGGAETVRYEPVDFAAVARGSGLAATVVESASELETALSGNWDGPRLIDARIDPAIYPHLIGVTRG